MSYDIAYQTLSLLSLIKNSTQKLKLWPICVLSGHKYALKSLNLRDFDDFFLQIMIISET